MTACDGPDASPDPIPRLLKETDTAIAAAPRGHQPEEPPSLAPPSGVTQRRSVTREGLAIKPHDAPPLPQNLEKDASGHGENTAPSQGMTSD